MKYPIHVGIIPDGCRRWATQKKLLPWEGHRHGIEVLEEIGRWSIKNLPIKYYTIYGLSMENLDRPAKQLKILAKLYARHFKRLAEDPQIHESEVQIGVVGRTELLPKSMQDAISLAVEKTQDYDKKFFRIALAYSGRLEIADAVNKIISQGGEVNEESISKNLYSDVPEPDLILRTAEKRMSNFLLWQGAYTEAFFLEKLWPDMEVADYKQVLEEFSERKRRYGK